jgi:hypothetical protein
MFKKLLFFIALFFMNNFSNAQEDLRAGVNLPPGVFVKEIPKIDFSNKLINLLEVPDNIFIDNGFLKNHPEEDLLEMNKKDMKSYEYYREATIFYNKLSNKVKATFSGPELWDIYYYDQELKSKLLTIK